MSVKCSLSYDVLQALDRAGNNNINACAVQLEYHLHHEQMQLPAQHHAADPRLHSCCLVNRLRKCMLYMYMLDAKMEDAVLKA